MIPRNAFRTAILLTLALTVPGFAQEKTNTPSDGLGFFGEVSTVSASQIVLKTNGTNGEELKTVHLQSGTKFTAGDWSTLRPGMPVFVGVEPDGGGFSAKVVSDLTGGGGAMVADPKELQKALSAGIATALKTGQTTKLSPVTKTANLTTSGAAIPNTTISGSMTTTTGQNVAGLTLQMYGLSDDTNVGTLVTNSAGAFSITGPFLGDYVFRLLDSNGRVISYSPPIFVIPGNSISGVKVPVEPMCKATNGYQPTSNSIDFMGCVGAPTVVFGADLNVPLYTGPNPSLPALTISLKRLELTISAGGGAFEFPFRFNAVDVTTRDLEAWSNNCIATGQSLTTCPNKPSVPAPTAPRPVAVSVQPIGTPGPALTWGGGVGPVVTFRITTGIGCGATGLSPCAFDAPIIPSPFFYNAKSPSGVGVPISSGGTLSANPVACIVIGLKQVLESNGVPSLIAGYISPLDFELCEPAKITAPANGFISQLSGINGTVTFQGQANPSIGFTGGEYIVYMQPDSGVSNTSIRFSNFNYVPTFEDQFQFRVTTVGNTAVTATTPLTVQTQQVPFIATPFPPVGSLTLQGTQRSFIDIPVAVASSGSITLSDFAPKGVGVGGGTTVTIRGTGFLGAKLSNGAYIPGTGVTDVLYDGQSVKLGGVGSYTIVSDTELAVVVPPYGSDPLIRAPLTVQGWGGSQTLRLYVAQRPVPDIGGQAAWNAPAGSAQPVIGVGFRHYLFDQSTFAPNSVTGIAVDGVSAAFAQCTSGSTSALCAGSWRNSNAWVFEAPRMSPGPHHVIVTAACDATSGLTNGAYCGTSFAGNSATSRDVLYYQGTPRLTSISKTIGVVAGGDRITLTGSGFTGLARVTVGSQKTDVCNYTGCPSVSDTSLTVTVPPGAVGVGVPVYVSTFGPSFLCPGLGSTCGDSEVLIYSYFGPPTVTSLSPSSGPNGGGTVVTVNGTGFTTATSMLLGSTPVSFTILDDQRITFTTPAGYPNLVSTLPGSLNLTVTASCGSGFPSATACGTSNPAAFTWNAPTNLTSTALTVAAVTGPAGGTALMTATLKAGSTPIAGRTITFTANGNTAGTAVTDASGVATLSAGSLAGVTSGIYYAGAVAVWGGDLVYAASSGSGQLTAKTSSIVTLGTAPAVPPVDHIASVAAGYSRLLALSDTGSVSGWGTTPFTPGGTLVTGGISTATAIATSKIDRDTSVALKADRSVTVWNDLGAGQCSGCSLRSVSASVGAIIMMGVDSTGKVVAWGNSLEDKAYHILNVPAAALSGVTAVAVGNVHATALKSDGTVVTWGCGTCGITPPAGLSGVVAVAAGVDGSSLALKSDGSLAGWGGSLAGRMPNLSGKRFVAIDFDGRNAAFALADDGDLYLLNNGGSVIASAGPNPLGFSAGYGWFAIRVPQRLLASGTVAAVSGKIGESKPISARFVSGDAPVSGVTVAFTLNGVSLGTATTDSSGVATVTATIPTLAAGTYPGSITATVGTDATWQGSTATGSLTVVTLPQTITFPAVTNRTYGDAAFDLGATASSGLPVTYTVNGGPISLSGSLATITGAGSVSITASQPGTTTYDPATSVTRTFSISKATLTVTPTPTTKVYGATATILNGTVTGFKYNDAGTMVGESDGQPSSAAVGRYVILARGVSFTSGDQANYVLQLLTPPTGTFLAVTAAPLTITAKSLTKAYGQAAQLGFTATGLKNNDSVASVTLTSAGADATVVPSATPYPITVSDATGTGLSNYTITYVDGALTVGKANLTISGTGTKSYGYTSKVNNIWPAGLVNGDTVTSVTFDSPGFAQFAPVSGSPYTLTVSAAVGTGLEKYNITYVPGQFEVFPIPLDIYTNVPAKTYGSAMTFTGGEFLIDQFNSLKGSDSVTSVQLSSAGTSATAASGTYGINIGGATGTGLSNYSISYFSGTLTVNPAPLTIRPAITTRQYGQGISGPQPASAFIVTGLLFDHTFTGGSFTGQGTDPAAPANAAYTLTPAGASGTGLGNYQINYTDGAIQVTPAPVTVTVASVSAVYDGKPRPVVPVTSPAGVAMNVTYNGSLTPPTNSGTYNVVATVANPNYVSNPSSATARVVITPGTAVLTWAKPAAITSTTALSATQLNATSTLPGKFVYTPAAGTFLKVGNGQTLSVTFTPNDPNSPKVTATTTLDVVVGVNLVIRSTVTNGPQDESGFVYPVVMSITNTGTQPATNVTLTALNFLSGNAWAAFAYSDTGAWRPNPVTIPAGGTVQVAFPIRANGGFPGGNLIMTWSGTYLGGSFSGSARATTIGF